MVAQQTKLAPAESAHSGRDSSESEDRLDRDTIVAHRYRIVRFAGSRGFGQVYQAEDGATDARVSLMRLDREFSRPEVRDRFFATRGSAQIEHRGAVDLTDYGEDLDGRLFLVMPWLEQADALDELLARTGRLPWARARALIEQIAEAIAAAHSRGILHGGLEPSRVLLDQQGNPHVLDFGLAPALESAAVTNANKPTPQITDSTLLAGKPAYMAPELVLGDSPTERTDIYALGLILWELISGKPPFTGGPVDTLHSQLHDPLPELVRAEAPPEVEALLHLALAKDPGERFASVTELLETLRALPTPAAPEVLPPTKTVPLPTGTPSASKPALAKSKPSVAPPPPSRISAAQPAVAGVIVASASPAMVPEHAPLEDQLHAIAREPSSPRELAPEPSGKRRFGLLERAIVGFLLFDLALFGAWKLIGGGKDQPEPEAIATQTQPDAALPEHEAPEPSVAELPSAAPIEPILGTTEDEPAPTPALVPEVGLADLPKQLGDADFRKTMVDGRDLIIARCLDDQRMRRTLKVYLDVAPSGQVEHAKILGALSETALGKCVARQARRIEFPPSREGGSHVYSLRLR